MTDPARDRFLKLVEAALDDGSLLKLTLGKPCGADDTLKNLMVRPVSLKSGPRLSFVWRHRTRDVTKNLTAVDARTEIARLLGTDFLDAHLFARDLTAQFLGDGTGGMSRVFVKKTRAESIPAQGHDRGKRHLLPAGTPWLRALGVTSDSGVPRQGQAAKYRQIQRFAEILAPLVEEAFPQDPNPAAPAPPLSVVDMGSGKGYLTFALAELLGVRASVTGIEQRQDLVSLCNATAKECGFSNLQFNVGTISDFELRNPHSPVRTPEVLIALHACDTATDDAIAIGIAAESRLIVVAPCCQKELRPQIVAPPELAPALVHGIFLERQAEFVTDALRVLLLEWAGYRTRAFEFVSSEHTAKNLMIAAVRRADAHPGDAAATEALLQFARFYGVRTHRLATHLRLALSP